MTTVFLNNHDEDSTALVDVTADVANSNIPWSDVRHGDRVEVMSKVYTISERVWNGTGLKIVLTSFSSRAKTIEQHYKQLNWE